MSRMRYGKTGAALAVAGLIVTGCSSTGTPTSAPVTYGTYSPPADLPTAAPTTPDVRTALLGWYNQGGGDLLTAIGDDNGQISTAASQYDFAALHTACGQLQTDVTRAQAFDQIPDTAVQVHWGAALLEYAQAAQDCLTGSATVDPTLIVRASNEIDTGTAQLNAATAVVNSYR